jgi:hypothetical protein
VKTLETIQKKMEITIHKVVNKIAVTHMVQIFLCKMVDARDVDRGRVVHRRVVHGRVVHRSVAHGRVVHGSRSVVHGSVVHGSRSVVHRIN